MDPARVAAAGRAPDGTERPQPDTAAPAPIAS